MSFLYGLTEGALKMRHYSCLSLLLVIADKPKSKIKQLKIERRYFKI